MKATELRIGNYIEHCEPEVLYNEIDFDFWIALSEEDRH